jgi:predicted ATP-grasp superfamily ATP-dependent carboligase
MPPPAEPVLICALSGRALAQAARAAGYLPIVLDAFGDLDMRAAAAAWARVPVDARWRFRRGALLAAARLLAPPDAPLVWGSGFERTPGLLAELAEGRPLWGTPPAVVRALKDPLRFAALARQVGVAHPVTRTLPPEPRASGWLLKRAGAAGGGHVRRAAGGTRRPLGRGWYWQREVPGRPVSALVVADGCGAVRVLGISEQWNAPWRGRRFRFGGVAAPAMLPVATRERLCRDAALLAVAAGVRGLASVDALATPDGWIDVLEINPRPGASLDAYGHAFGMNLFRLHREACAGRLPETWTVDGGAAGSLIVYARRRVRIDPGAEWPAWSADRTPHGTLVAAGGPVCSVLATGADADEVRRRLARRASAIDGLMLLPGGTTDDDPATAKRKLRLAAPRRSSVAPPSPGDPRSSARPGTGR